MKQKKESYLGNPLLKSSGVKTSFTKDQIEEYIKCEGDPIYFIENYVKIVHPDHGLIKFDLREYQKKLIDIYHNNRFSISLLPRQSGKCVYKDTKIRIRNKKTKKIEEISIEDFYNKVR